MYQNSPARHFRTMQAPEYANKAGHWADAKNTTQSSSAKQTATHACSICSEYKNAFTTCTGNKRITIPHVCGYPYMPHATTAIYATSTQKRMHKQVGVHVSFSKLFSKSFKKVQRWTLHGNTPQCFHAVEVSLSRVQCIYRRWNTAPVRQAIGHRSNRRGRAPACPLPFPLPEEKGSMEPVFHTQAVRHGKRFEQPSG